MTDDNDNTLRAVFFAALMVLWVFAGTVAFAGSAAAVSDGDLDNTQVALDSDAAGATTGYTITTSFDNTSDTTSDNPSGVAAVEIDLSDASQFGGNTDNFTGASDVTVTIDDPNAGDYGENQNREVQLQDTTTDGDSIALDFQEKENVSDDATLTVDFDDVITNPSVDDTYELEFLSYTDEGPSNTFESATVEYQIEGDAGAGDDDRNTDEKFAGGSTRWKGQVLDFQATPGACNIDEDTYQLRYYTPGDENGDQAYGTLIREISLNDTDGAQIPTDNVADNEQVVITAEDPNTNQQEIIDVGPEAGAPAGQQTADCFSSDGDDTTVGEDDYVEIVPQTLDTEFEEDSVRVGENATLEVDSNRNGYDLYVASDDFSQSELAAIVNDSSTANINEDRAPSDDSIRVNNINSSAEIDFDFAGEDTGNYSFEFTPTDTTPMDNASIEVQEELEGNAEFDSDSGAFTVKRGDIQSPQGDSDSTISVDTQGIDFVVVVIGDEERNNYEVAVTAEPDADGNVDIRMNTFIAGRLNESNESRAYEAENGTIVDVDRRSDDPITGVLDEGQYDLVAQDTDGNEYDAGVVNVEPSSYNNLTQMRHPDATLGSLDEKTDLVNNSDLSETDLVTLADRDRSEQRDVLVHKVDISGIYGALDAIAENDLDNANGNQVLADAQSEEGLGFADEPVLDVELNQTNFRQNREPKRAQYQNPNDDDQFRFVIDEDNETLYIVTDVRELELTRATGDDTEDAMVDPGDDFEFEFETGPGFENAYEGGIDTYVPEGETDVQLDTEDRELEFDEQGADQVRVNNAANQTISGETNVAPGTEITIAVDSTSRTRRANDTQTGDLAPVFQRGSATVGENGTFADDSFDFSDNEVGREFVVTAPNVGVEDAAEKPGIVVQGTPASVTLSDITVGPDQDELSTITVDTAYLPQGGFVTIHDGTLQDGAVLDSVRGTSAYLEADTNLTDVEVPLDDPYTEDGTAIAMPHQDTDNDEEYDFVTSEGQEDAPYTAGDENNIVTASASVTFEDPTPTPTDEPDPTATPTDEPETATPTDTSEDQPGFGAALALIALLGAALLAARRNDF
jgi:PGF-CTERM protein/surface glycoprotein (TIGR04207 family)